MSFTIIGLRARAAVVAVSLLAFSAAAQAQEIADSHLNAAREAIDAINATDQYDVILPQAAQQLKAELIQKDPNLQSVINATVDEKALALAGRRADLEREAATAYARVFSEQELKDIAAFYTSPAGQKLLADGPIVTREIIKAAQIWQEGIMRDLAQAVGEQLASVAGQQQPQATGAAAEPVVTPPAEGSTPGGSANQ